MGCWVGRRFGFAAACAQTAVILAIGSGCGDEAPGDAAPSTAGSSGSAGLSAAGSGGSTIGSTGTAGSAGAAGRAGSGATAGAGANNAQGGGGAGGAAAGMGAGGAGAGAGSAGAGAGGSSAGAGGSAGSAGGAGRAGNGGTAGSAGSGPVIGDGGTVNATIIVRSGQTYDGQNKRFRAGSALGDGSQSEDQQPVFRVEDGGRLINVVLGAPAADGIHTYGDATLMNIVWEDVGEDALTMKEEGNVVLDGGSAANGEDKVFQLNAPGTFRVSNFRANNAGKFIRQNGTTKFDVDVFIDRCDISNMDESIFRTDSLDSDLTMTNTRYSNIGDGVFRRGDDTNAPFMGSGNTED
jgi:hypothetical protein